ncbi:MAG: peptidylprolyl isomerase, partial [Myxococcales bacterium]
VARDLSDDPGSKATGGGYDSMEGFVAPFRKAADALKPGETTDGAVETQFGYHIIAKDDPAKRAEIEATLKKWVARSLYLKAKGAEAAKDLASKIQAQVKAGKTLDAAIKEILAPLVKPAAVLEPITILFEASDAGAPPARRTNTEKPLFAPTADTDPDRPKAETSTSFNAGGDPFEGLSSEVSAQVIKFAFAAKDGDVMPEPVRTTGGVAFVALKDRKAVTREDYDKERDTQIAQLLAVKQAEALALYVRRLREVSKAEIKIDEAYLRDPVDSKDGGVVSTDEDE